MIRRTLLFFVLIMLFHGAFAQNWGKPKGPTTKGRIIGTVIDSLSGQPIEFATLLLESIPDGKQVGGGITEADGSFKLIEIPTGQYRLRVSFIGYAERIVANVETTPEKPDLDLKTIFLLPAGLDLEQVTVTAEAALVENRIDKLVYNAEKDASTTGGNGADVLRNVPLLSVDLDGNVSLRGSQNVQILINGRPSTLFGAS
ncbi:MAG: hypothetical protein D6772_04355, partial [Bacteroidetes bacterium]